MKRTTSGCCPPHGAPEGPVLAAPDSAPAVFAEAPAVYRAHGPHRSADEQRRLLARIKRIEGQVAAIRRMVEADAYCVDVLTQVAAARGALSKVGEEVLQRHVETCVADAFAHGDADARQDKIDELVQVFARYSGRGGA